MYYIYGKKITMTRGDTLKAELSIKDSEGHEYVPQENDVIVFSIKKTFNDTQYIVQKTVSHSTMMVELDPSDTKTLDYGTYVWDAQITFDNGDVDTFIDRGTLELTGEVS